MKLLSIVRHAKAERPDAYATDHERPLTKRGRADSRLVAKMLAKIVPAADYIVSSTAARTHETVEEIIKAMGYQGSTIWSDALYLATAPELLRTLSETPSEIEHVIICGHNPGMEELAVGLCAGASIMSICACRPPAVRTYNWKLCNGRRCAGGVANWRCSHHRKCCAYSNRWTACNKGP